MPQHQASKPRRLRELLATGTIAVPGAFNALTAIQIERAGFEALYISGAGLSAGRALPDIGLLSFKEVLDEAAAIAGAVAIPALLDVDTGFGPPLAVMRTVRACERAGLAGMQIEDQELPKKCGHLPGKRLVSTEEMTGKLRAACDARRDPDFVIIARTDARAIEGLDGAVARARAYVQAGADAVFTEALQSKEEFLRFAEGLSRGGKVPLIANMTEFGKTPYLSVAEFEELGYHLVLFPVSALRVATKAVEALLQTLKDEGSQRGRLQDMHTRQQLYDLLQYEEYERRARAYQPEHDGPDGR